jgi:hypothetical protein
MDFFVEWILKDFLVEYTHKILFQQSHSNPQDFFIIFPDFFFSLAEQDTPATRSRSFYLQFSIHFTYFLMAIDMLIAYKLKYCSCYIIEIHITTQIDQKKSYITVYVLQECIVYAYCNKPWQSIYLFLFLNWFIVINLLFYLFLLDIVIILYMIDSYTFFLFLLSSTFFFLRNYIFLKWIT